MAWASTATVHPPLSASAGAARCSFVCASLMAIAIWATALPAALGQQPLSDQQLKSAFVLNFVRYTEWPERSFASPDAALTVCTLGDPGTSLLAGMKGRVVKGRTIQIRAATNADEARGCHALFVSEADARRFVVTLRALQDNPVLTIGDAEGFIDAGGMVGLVHLDNRLQFEINLGVVRQAHLKASSQLLRLARNVIEARPH